MALKLSTALRNALLGDQAEDSGTAIALVQGTPDTITDSDSSFLTNGFRAGMVLTVSNSTSSDGSYGIASVVAGTITLTTTTTIANESSDADLAITQQSGGLRDIFKHCVMRIYSGSQPSDADSAETGTLLATISVSAGTVTAGSSTNALDFDSISDGTISKSASETWSGTAVATGTAGYFRLYANNYITGASTTGIRLDGACATSGSQLNLSSTSITSGATVTVDTFSVTMPAS